MISPNAKGGSLALVMVHEDYAFRGDPFGPLAYTAPLGPRPSKLASHDSGLCRCEFEFEAHNSIRCNQTSVTMWLGTNLSRAECAFLTRLRSTSRATDGLHLFESRLLGLHRCPLCGTPRKKSGQFRTGISDTWRKIAIALKMPGTQEMRPVVSLAIRAAAESQRNAGEFPPAVLVSPFSRHDLKNRPGTAGSTGRCGPIDVPSRINHDSSGGKCAIRSSLKCVEHLFAPPTAG